MKLKTRWKRFRNGTFICSVCKKIFINILKFKVKDPSIKRICPSCRDKMNKIMDKSYPLNNIRDNRKLI